MSKSSQENMLNKKADIKDDEIEFIDILRIIWKWKYLILGGAAVCALAVLVFSPKSPMLFRIETTIRPGILGISDEGESIYIDTSNNIKDFIEAGALDSKILNSLTEFYGEKVPNRLNFKVTLAKRSHLLNIIYETPQIDQGIETLDLLVKFLAEEYGKSPEYIEHAIDRKIKSARAEIENSSNIKHLVETKISNIEKRINALKTRMVAANKNTKRLKEERDMLLANKQNGSYMLSAILYTNARLQNLQLENKYQNEITNLTLKRDSELIDIIRLENKRQLQIIEIDKLESKKDMIQNIQVIRKPYSHSNPIRSNKMRNVLLATMFGLFMMIFLSFFLESITKHIKK